jgi:hypothetical protein
VSDELHQARLGEPLALAVASSDVMSSCAYGTEEILGILVPEGIVVAFALATRRPRSPRRPGDGPMLRAPRRSPRT